MAKRVPKIELTLLKKLMGELEIALTATQELPYEQDEETHKFVMEMAKTSGLCAAVAQEASALVKDMYQVSRYAQQPAVSFEGNDLLAELFGAVPGADKNRN